jgi:hypothetical protein
LKSPNARFGISDTAKTNLQSRNQHMHPAFPQLNPPGVGKLDSVTTLFEAPPFIG